MSDAVSPPIYPLALVRELLAEGAYRCDSGRKCLGALLEQIESLVEAYQFIEAVIPHVSEDDFCGTTEIKQLGIEGLYDEYAFRVPEAVIDRFGLTRRHWYLKLKIVENRGRRLFMLSLHPLHYDERRRRGGPLLQE